MINKQIKKAAFYIHWPFCLSRCPYCDFNAHVREKIDNKAWENAYISSLQYYARLLPSYEVQSIFFGGGTPSLMDPKLVQTIISEIRRNWEITKDIEVTLEANPTSIEINKFKAFKEAGVNRISIGIQSLDNKALKFLGREHDRDNAINALEIAKSVFENFSFDLIYARPDQTLKEWKGELEQALTYAGNHLSLYQLTIEKGTPFYSAYKSQAFKMPDDSLSADFYDLTQDMMNEAGLPAYEVSNHAATGCESRHNMAYWHYDDYIGVGPGAHGRISYNGGKFSTRAHTSPENWLSKVQENGHGAYPHLPIEARDQFIEGFMVGLRLSSGVCLDNLSSKTGFPWEKVIDVQRLSTAVQQKWILRQENSIHLTRNGMLRLNSILDYLINIKIY